MSVGIAAMSNRSSCLENELKVLRVHNLLATAMPAQNIYDGYRTNAAVEPSYDHVQL